VRDDGDPFDLANLRLTPEAAAAMGRAAAKQARAQPKRQRQQFVIVPWRWVERLKAARHVATFRVALYVLYQDWKTGKPVPVSNKALDLSPRSKWRAVRELERMRLVSVQTHPARAPVVTIIPLNPGHGWPG
jgi:hypothetical protein